MKKLVKFVGGIVLVGGLLVGCGQQASQPVNKAEKVEQSKPVQKKEVVKPTPAPAPSTERQLKVVKTAVGANGYTVKDGFLNLTLNEVTLKEVDNPSPEELQNVGVYSNGKDISQDKFYYVHIKYTAENTSTKDVIFHCFPDVVVFSGQTQEEINSQMANFITNEEDYQGTYYGEVVKHGEVGYVINMNPATADKIRIEIGGTMDNETYNSYSDSQVVTFPLQ